ncbi:alpha/beta hydrolase [Thermogemmatispora tikiterensis]|uniref:Uncharacterized protein n=1 Tax=Thermogemmatispora tikiterensis TaxID=1825093 RepID=A0A328VHI1_9CHLR|nr:hypothetical protein [Thermogemmatispora tikiterensis]RAQ95103.1 hypothetical protein A4R35_06115 [Thermogemmatispora tikiterensis]
MSLHDRSFGWLRSQVLELYHQQDYARARDLTEEALPFFPEHWSTLVLWRAILTLRLGSPEEALAILEEAIGQGLWFGPAQLGDEDLAPLRSLPAFAALEQTCQERYAEAQTRSHPGILVLEPDNLVPPPYPTLFALHGNQSSPLAELEYWQPIMAHRWQVALPCSSQLVGYGLASWNDEVRAMDEVCTHWEQQQRWKRIDLQHVVLAGFSRGARIALRLALEGRIPAIGFIAICPALEASQILLPQDACQVRLGFVLLGEHDQCAPTTLAAIERLRAAGLACEVKLYPGLGHFYPPTFSEELPALLAHFVPPAPQ